MLYLGLCCTWSKHAENRRTMFDCRKRVQHEVSMAPPRKPPLIALRYGPPRVAALLIEQAGGAGKAHKYVTRVARLMQKEGERGRPPLDDAQLLLVVDAIQRQSNCLWDDALKQTAKMIARDAKGERAIITRLRRKYSDRRDPRIRAERALEDPRRFDFRLHKIPSKSD
jgi:hypothetical protein